jgi:hypothetical protein
MASQDNSVSDSVKLSSKSSSKPLSRVRRGLSGSAIALKSRTNA